MTWFSNLTNWLWGPPLLIAIILCGIVFLIRNRGFQFSHLFLILKAPFKKDPEIVEDEKSLSPLQAVSIAIGQTVGVANISGVSTAIAVGGPGALFWLWFASLLGMGIKMAEVSLACYYRKSKEDGTYTGGPTYYMKYGLGKERNFKFWKVLSVPFGLGIFTTAILNIQNYTVAEAVGSTFGINYIIPGAVMCVLAIIMLVGGLKKVGKLASYLVPFMCVFYVACVIIVLVMNFENIPEAFSLIFKGAFSGTAAVGGFAGATVMMALQKGFQRSVYSNEAGWGTSPMIHATANTNHPIKEGIYGAFEVFIDSIVVCTATGLVVIVSGQWNSGIMGAELTLISLETTVGHFARVIMAFSVFLFGLTTVTGLCTYYRCLLDHAIPGENIFKEKILFVLGTLLCPIAGFITTVITVIYGGTPASIWVIADFTSAIPTFINVVTILILSKKFGQLLKDYKARYLGIGKVDPNFSVFYEDKLKKSEKL